jgi:hypothetical protein
MSGLGDPLHSFKVFHLPSNWSSCSGSPKAHGGKDSDVRTACETYTDFVHQYLRLISKERYEEALDTLAYYHANGDRNNVTVQFEYTEMRDTIRMEEDANTNSSYLDFFKTKGNRWRLAILISLGIISQYSGNALFSNYINLVYEGAGITDTNQKMGVSCPCNLFFELVSNSNLALWW